MSLTVELSPDEQARFAAAAKREVLSPAELARKVLTNHLPPKVPEPQRKDPTLALLEQWAEEDAGRTPEEAAQENELWDQFQANVNASRAALGMRQL
jgi:hypothetical protein